MANIINDDFEFSKNWENSGDFPTREFSESQVRADIQLLFDELKNYINGTIASALNNHESRIAALGGGGTVGHDVIGDDAVEDNNIKDGAVIEGKLGEGAVTLYAMAEESVDTDQLVDNCVTLDKLHEEVDDHIEDVADERITQLFTPGSVPYTDLVALIKRVAAAMTYKEWGITK